MTETMRAVFVRAPFQVEIRKVSIPETKPGCILVKVEPCGICGTDLHTARGVLEWGESMPRTRAQVRGSMQA